MTKKVRGWKIEFELWDLIATEEKGALTKEELKECFVNVLAGFRKDATKLKTKNLKVRKIK